MKESEVIALSSRVHDVTALFWRDLDSWIWESRILICRDTQLTQKSSYERDRHHPLKFKLRWRSSMTVLDYLQMYRWVRNCCRSGAIPLVGNPEFFDDRPTNAKLCTALQSNLYNSKVTEQCAVARTRKVKAAPRWIACWMLKHWNLKFN